MSNDIITWQPKNANFLATSLVLYLGLRPKTEFSLFPYLYGQCQSQAPTLWGGQRGSSPQYFGPGPYPVMSPSIICMQNSDHWLVDTFLCPRICFTARQKLKRTVSGWGDSNGELTSNNVPQTLSEIGTNHLPRTKHPLATTSPHFSAQSGRSPLFSLSE